ESDPTIVYPVHPDFVGHDAPKILMGKKSGLDNIELWIQKLGIELDRDEAMSVLQVVKQQSHDLKRVLTEDEFSKIVREVKA
ncbi:MAG: pyruvate carboxyltransferase, partial [Deltaproteobacteria bacterium]